MSSYTENGALGYRTTGKHLLDLNFKVASLRKADAETIISGFDKAFSEDHIHALKWLFYLRDYITILIRFSQDLEISYHLPLSTMVHVPNQKEEW